MMAMAKAAILAVAAVAALAVQVQLAAAVDHPVGGDGSWDASGSSYDSWSAKQIFKQNDTLSFKFSQSHDVTEVTKAGYDACSGANAVKSYTGGSATIKLTAPGKRYFICSAPGHCDAGMKLEVNVVAAAVTVTAPAPAKSKPAKPRHQRSVGAPTPAPVPAPDAAAPSTDESSTPTTAAPSPKSSDAAAMLRGNGKAFVVGLAAVGVAMALLAM